MADTTASDWQILRDFLTAEYDRLAAHEQNLETGVWFSGMRHGYRSALAYMDGIEEGRASSSVGVGHTEHRTHWAMDPEHPQDASRAVMHVGDEVDCSLPWCRVGHSETGDQT
jgi:hypothetical protein